MTFEERLDRMEIEIHKPAFRKNKGRANEVNYWVFDYPPQRELEVRERVEYMKVKNQRGNDDFELVVCDLYDLVIDILEKEDYIEQTCRLEERGGLERITKALGLAFAECCAVLDTHMRR